MKAKLDVRMPEAPPLPERHALLSAREPRELRLLVRPHDGAVVLVLRGDGDTGAWEIKADAWRYVAERVAQAQADPRRAGAVIMIGMERRGATSTTLDAITSAAALLAEQE